jgi:hypothetical protein
MALTTSAAILNLGNLLSIAGSDVTDCTATPKHKLGTLSITVDAFGFQRIFRYCRLMLAGTPGLVFDRVALVTGTTDSAGTTTSAIDASIFTAGDEVGKIFQVNVASGAAPEGEVALIISNTATTVRFDPGYPLSVAAASGITFSDWGVAHYDAGALASNNINCGGILMGTPVAKDYGWTQIQGFHPAVQVDPNSAAITADAAGQMGATSFVVLLATGASQQQDYIGWFPMATSTTAVQAAFIIDVFGQAQPVS